MTHMAVKREQIYLEPRCFAAALALSTKMIQVKAIVYI